MKQKVDEMGNLYFATEGDSGRIAYMIIDDKPVIFSACTQPAAGPDYSSAHDILKAFVEQYGDTLKEI